MTSLINSQKEQSKKPKKVIQDEDIDSDEDLVTKTQKDNMRDLKQSIN